MEEPTIMDVTDAMHAQEALSHALKAREEMLAIVSHDLRSPLGSILMSAAMIQCAGERMNEMIEDLLNLAKIEAVEMMSAQAQEKNIKIETSGTDQPLQMSCDHNQVLRVFSNLIGNAVKFTPEFGSIKITAEDCGNEAMFSISDTGPGIAEHHIPHVFDRFWQASKTQLYVFENRLSGSELGNTS
jgi:signal transduction histidine kinase